MGFVHNGVVVAIVAHGLIGISLIWDKVLLRQPQTKDLISYVFWLGAISVFGLALIPFGFKMPGWETIAVATGAGALHLVSVYFYMAALKAGEASQAPAIMGGFSPVATALIGAALLPETLTRSQFLPFTLMTLGGFVMFFTERLHLRRIIIAVVVSSATYGLTEVLQKVAFDETNFVTGYVFFTIGTFIAALCLLVPPRWRHQIFRHSQQAEPRSKFWYMVNRFIAGVGSFLIFYAISLTSPALVEAITGLRYALIFLGAYWLTKFKPDWLQENYRGLVLWGKVVATALIVAGLVLSGVQGGTQAGSPTARQRYEDPGGWKRGALAQRMRRACGSAGLRACGSAGLMRRSPEPEGLSFRGRAAVGADEESAWFSSSTTKADSSLRSE